MTNYSSRISDENITELKQNQIFVFGSNLAGRHGLGAAKTALGFGAIYGKGHGLVGRTYAIPTKDGMLNTLPIESIQFYVNNFIKYAFDNFYLTFLVTKIGCGLASYTEEQIAPMFLNAIQCTNIHLPLSFWKIIEAINFKTVLPDTCVCCKHKERVEYPCNNICGKHHIELLAESNSICNFFERERSLK